MRGKQTPVVWLAEQHRRTLCLMQSARRCRVRAYREQGVRPHINLHGVRYTNGVLATSAHLIGQHLLIYMNADDLRAVRAFLADGTELGALEAQGAWQVVPHNLKLRQEIRKQTGKHRRRTNVESNPIDAYVQEKLTQAKKTRKVATELAHAMRLLASAPTVRTPVGPVHPAESETAVAADTMPMKVRRQPRSSSSRHARRRARENSRSVPVRSFNPVVHVGRYAMSRQLPRPIDPSLHPLVTGSYRLATPAIEAFYELVTRCLRYRIMGALIYGPSRVGKTRAIEYMRLPLARQYPKITTYHAQCEHKPRHAEGPFFANLREAVGDHAPNAGTSSAKRLRLALRIREAAARAGNGTVILFCDESQRYNENEYEWLRDVHDALDRQQIKLFTFLVGQEELLAQKTALQIAGKTQTVARLMVEELAF